MSVLAWVSEVPREPTMRCGSELEQPPYYSPREHHAFFESEAYCGTLQAREYAFTCVSARNFEVGPSHPIRAVSQLIRDRETTEAGRSAEVPSTIRQTLGGYISALIATLLGRESICDVRIYDDDLYGAVANITIDLPAKEALELWLKLVDYLPYEDYKTVLAITWLGGNNISEDELINYIVKIMIKSKVGPKALPGFNALRIVQEIRE